MVLLEKLEGKIVDDFDGPVAAVAGMRPRVSQEGEVASLPVRRRIRQTCDAVQEEREK